jgi:hypothetical protein
MRCEPAERLLPRSRVHPRNADVVYVGSIVAASTDGGKTFATFRGAGRRRLSRGSGSTPDPDVILSADLAQ